MAEVEAVEVEAVEVEAVAEAVLEDSGQVIDIIVVIDMDTGMVVDITVVDTTVAMVTIPVAQS